MYGDTEYVTPILWKIDELDEAIERNEFYGISGYPTAILDGVNGILGGGATVYTSYYNKYIQCRMYTSPVKISSSLVVDDQNRLVVTAKMELDDDIIDGDNRVFFTLLDGENDLKAIASSETQLLNISTSGETQVFTQTFDIEQYWDLENIKAVIVVQDFDSKEVVQSDITWISPLETDFSSDIQTGAIGLGVQFYNNSFPSLGDDSFEWDFDNDGIVDSTEENPYFIYETTGTYSVCLKVTRGDESSTSLKENFIEVGGNSSISGNISGVWKPENGVYTISGDVTILKSSSLFIESGTTISIESNSISVRGKLISNGSKENPVNIVSESGWKGLKFIRSSEESRISYTTISNSSDTGIYVNSSKLTIDNSFIIWNSGENYGAAISIVNSEDVEVNNCFISGNENINSTGGIEIKGSSPIIKNSIIVNNSSGHAGAIGVENSSNPIITNCTIYNNLSTVSEIFVLNSDITIENSIVVGENQSVKVINGEGNINYSLIDDVNSGAGNISGDPQFISPSNGLGTDNNGISYNWLLSVDSPAIDSGNPDPIYNDIDNGSGEPLFPALGSLRNDIGAFGGSGFDYHPIFPITIKTISTSSEPIENCYIELKDIESEVELSGYSNSEGFIEFNQFPMGEFILTISVDGFENYSSNIVVLHSKEIEIELNDTGDIEDNIICSSTLEQNYPNPFNPKTTINYYLQKEGEIEIVVRDCAGREVWSSGVLEGKIGNGRVIFDGSSFSSGTYLYSIKFNGVKSATKRMVLIK